MIQIDKKMNVCIICLSPFFLYLRKKGEGNRKETFKGKGNGQYFLKTLSQQKEKILCKLTI